MHRLFEVRTHVALIENDYEEPKTVYADQQVDVWDQWHRQ